MDFEKYKEFSSNNKDLKADFKPLNFDKLKEAGVFRVTNVGLSGSEFLPDPKAGFSIVSAYNDKLSNEGTVKWPDNPNFYNIVKDMFLNRPEDIQAHKYLQIINSAKDMGLSDKDIFYQNVKE